MVRMSPDAASVALHRMEEAGFVNAVGNEYGFSKCFEVSISGNYWFENSRQWDWNGIVNKVVIPLLIGVVGVMLSGWLTRLLWP